MHRYQLAKLVDWAGTLESRKRLQKVVYMLKSVGCPLDADFYLHRYGPYSEEVARLTDDMVAAGILDETEESFGTGSKFSYRLDEAAKERLADFEQTERGRKLASDLAPYEQKALALLKADLRELEYASTIRYFWEQEPDWDNAVNKAAQFKQTKGVCNALALAQMAKVQP